MKELMKKLMSLLAGTQADDASKKQIADLMAELEKIDTEVKLPEGTDDAKHNAAIIKQLTDVIKESKAETAALKAQLDKLVSSDDAAKKAAADAAKTEAEKKAQAKVDEAIKAGRIPPKNDELVKHWKEQLTSNYEIAEKLLDAIPATTAGSGTPKTGEQKPAEKKTTIAADPFTDYVQKSFTINN